MTNEPNNEKEKINNSKTIIKIVTAALTVLFVLLVIALIVNLVKLGAVNSRKAKLEAQNARLEQVIAENDKMIDACQNDPQFIEDYAREMLDMVYRDEIVINGK